MSFMLKKLVYRRKSELSVSWGVCDFMSYFTRSFSYGLCPLVKLLLGFSWIEKGGHFLNVALFMGPQYSGQNQSMGNNEKAFMWSVTVMNLASRWSYFWTYLQCWSKIFSLWIGAGRSEHVPRVVYERLKSWKLLNILLQIKIVANAYGRP